VQLLQLKLVEGEGRRLLNANEYDLQLVCIVRLVLVYCLARVSRRYLAMYDLQMILYRSLGHNVSR